MLRQYSNLIKAEAIKAGFDFCGIAAANPFTELKEYYSRFIGEKKFAGLGYLEKYSGQRLDPSLLMPGIRSVIAVLFNYYPKEVIPTGDNFVIAKYAYGRDHHTIMKEKMTLLLNFLRYLDPDCKSRMFVDSGPVLEKSWAQRCGIGWQGKNTLILNKKAGSFFFIGVIYTDLELEYDLPGKNHCGNCRRCLDACPTGALTAPYELDPAKCISYHTIETKEEIPGEILKNLNNRIFGCDICQDVCPYNKRFARPTRESGFHLSEELSMMRKKDWQSLTKEKFNRLFKHSAIKRTGYDKLMSTIRAL